MKETHILGIGPTFKQICVNIKIKYVLKQAVVTASLFRFSVILCSTRSIHLIFGMGRAVSTRLQLLKRLERPLFQLRRLYAGRYCSTRFAALPAAAA